MNRDKRKKKQSKKEIENIIKMRTRKRSRLGNVTKKKYDKIKRDMKKKQEKLKIFEKASVEEMQNIKKIS